MAFVVVVVVQMSPNKKFTEYIIKKYRVYYTLTTIVYIYMYNSPQFQLENINIVIVQIVNVFETC